MMTGTLAEERTRTTQEGLQNRNHETFSNTKMLFTLLTCMINLGVQKGLGWMDEGVCLEDNKPHESLYISL